MKVEGACHCGNIRFEADVAPETTSICHCTDCQTLSGSAFRTVVPVQDTDFRMTGGQPSIYVKTAESGNQRQQAFCGKCGSPIYSAPPGDGPKAYFIRVGTIRQRDAFVPKAQVWARSRQAWLADVPSVSISKDTQ